MITDLPPQIAELLEVALDNSKDEPLRMVFADFLTEQGYPHLTSRIRVLRQNLFYLTPLEDMTIQEAEDLAEQANRSAAAWRQRRGKMTR